MKKQVFKQVKEILHEKRIDATDEQILESYRKHYKPYGNASLITLCIVSDIMQIKYKGNK